MRRMKAKTKRKIAGIIAGAMALAMLVSAISVVPGLFGSSERTQQNTVETTTKAE